MHILNSGYLGVKAGSGRLLITLEIGIINSSKAYKKGKRQIFLDCILCYNATIYLEI